MKRISGKTMITLLAGIILFSCITLLSGNSSADMTIADKAAHIKKVANRIWGTVTQPYRKPEIVCYEEKVRFGKQKAEAYYLPDSNKIYFGSKLYGLCMEIGEEALAAVVAHEMGHYFYHHTLAYTAAGYALSPSDSLMISDKSVGAAEELEAQADIFAAMKCYSAGYDIGSAMPAILKKIYDHNGKPDKLKGYMPLSDRQAVAAGARATFERLRPLYEAANYLYIIGEHEFAGDIYKYITENRYTCWEMYANAGCCYALAALRYMPEEKRKYLYPFQVQANKKILPYGDLASHKGMSRESSDLEYRRRFLLSEAENFLEDAAHANKLASVNFVNLSSLKAIRGKRFEQANADAEEALRLAQTEAERNLAHTAKGLVMALCGKKPIALNEFGQAKDSLLIAQYNLCVLAGGGCSAMFGRVDEKPRPYGSKAKERIAGFVQYEAPKAEWNGSAAAEGLDGLKIDIYSAPDHKAIKIENDYGGIFLAEAFSNYADSSARGIRCGDSAEKVTAAYGEPQTIRGTNAGEYLIFRSLGIAFKIAGGKVQSWMLFEEL